MDAYDLIKNKKKRKHITQYHLHKLKTHTTIHILQNYIPKKKGILRFIRMPVVEKGGWQWRMGIKRNE